MDTEAAIDLSLRNRSPVLTERPTRNDVSTILRPIPRPAWSIIWYQKLWPHFSRASTNNFTNNSQHLYANNERSRSSNENNNSASDALSQKYSPITNEEVTSKEDRPTDWKTTSLYLSEERNVEDLEQSTEKNSTTKDNDSTIIVSRSSSSILDIACCDGPVKFERISNPNFALTVEHSSGPSSTQSSTANAETRRNLTSKTYLCIYCNQSFKSLFCYQKHKKRHLNPVSIDITASHLSTPRVSTFTNKSKTKDLNVQFFPCKKCGCKFPSYYFVHKHKKICH